MKDLLEINTDATEDELYNTRYTTKDYSKQFTEIRDREPVELYANLMYLSNQLAHVFGEKENIIGNDTSYSSQMAFIKKALMNIKEWCIHKIISQKKSGANIELVVCNKNDDKKYSSIFAVALPNYFEPFIVHIPRDFLSDDELRQCYDDINRVWKDELKTTFPAYISDEKAKLLEKIYREKYMKSGRKHGTVKDRLRLFLNTRNRLAKHRTIKGEATTSSTKERTKNSINQPNEHDSENLELIHEVQQLRGEVSALTKELEGLKRKLANSRRMLNKSQKSNQRLIRDNKSLEQENERLKNRNSETEAKLQKISGILRQGDDENEK